MAVLEAASNPCVFRLPPSQRRRLFAIAGASGWAVNAIPFNEGLSMKRNGASRPVSACVFTGTHRATRAVPLLLERYWPYTTLAMARSLFVFDNLRISACGFQSATACLLSRILTPQPRSRHSLVVDSCPRFRGISGVAAGPGSVSAAFSSEHVDF